jgi:hypothetical protein
MGFYPVAVVYNKTQQTKTGENFIMRSFIICNIMKSGIKLAGHVERMGEKRSLYKVRYGSFWRFTLYIKKYA